MEEDIKAQKAAGLYLIFLESMSSIVISIQITWPISCFLIQEYLDFSPSSIGYFAGILSLSYTLGKLLLYKPVAYTLSFSSTKLVLFSLFLSAAVSVISYGLINNFAGILVCRFVTGGLSNSQQYLRTFLMRTCTSRTWPEFTKHALFFSRLGIILGISISAFTLRPSDYFAGQSEFSDSLLLLGSVCMLMLYLIGLMLLLSIEYRGTSVAKAEKYVELPEVKEGSEPGLGTETGLKTEKYGFEKYIKNIEAVTQDEVLYTDELKSYTSRDIVNRQKNRRMYSAAPKIEEGVVVPQAERENREGNGKCTHISFIDGDENEIEAAEQPSVKEIIKEKVEQVEVNSRVMLTYAQNYRAASTFFVAFTVEAIPYWLFLQDPTITPYKLGGLLLFIAGISILLGFFTHNLLLKKIPHEFLAKALLGLLLFCTATLAIIGRYSLNIWISVGLLTVVMYCIELLMPIGNILISDSTEEKYREDNFRRSNLICLSVKSLAVLIGPAAVSLAGVLSMNFWISAIGFCLVLRYSSKIPAYFPNTTGAPYKEDA